MEPTAAGGAEQKAPALPAPLPPHPVAFPGLWLRGQGAAYSLAVDTETAGLCAHSPEGLVTFRRKRYIVRGCSPSTTYLVAYPLDEETWVARSLSA